MGYSKAQMAVGDAYAQIGFYCLPRDQAQAAEWWEAAAEQGDKEVLSMIVCCYQRGIGVKQDHSAAARLLRHAADRGDETAPHSLKVLIEEFGAPYDGNGDDC